MELSQVSLPPQLITLERAKNHLKVDFSADDDLINLCCKSAQDYIQAETGRLIGEQTWDVLFDTWPKDRTLELKTSPLNAVTSVKYLDTTGAEQTLSSSKYTVARGFVSRIVLRSTETWPDLDEVPHAVRVRVVAGWKVGANLSLGESELPNELLKLAYNLLNHYYEHRELFYTGLQLHKFPEDATAKRVCAHYQRVNA